MKNILFACALGLLSLGCTAGPPPNARDVKIEITGAAGHTIEGNVRAASPGTAGMATKGFSIPVPGNLEFKGGPSEYTLQVTSGMPEQDTIKIYVDGKELPRGSDVVYEADKGPRLTFTVADKPGATP